MADDLLEFPFEPLNPLHRMLMRARLVSEVAEKLGEELRDPMAATDGYAAPSDSELIPVRKLRQINAVQRTIDALRQDALDVVYVDEVFWTPIGIDIIAIDPTSESVVFCESKATSRPFSDSLTTYLRSTRRKGRQMTWGWIIDSVDELHRFGPTASIFFRIIRSLAEGRVERRLYVWKAEDTRGPLEGTVPCRTWSEGSLSAHPLFAETLSPVLREMLQEIDRNDPLGGLLFWSRGSAR